LLLVVWLETNGNYATTGIIMAVIHEGMRAIQDVEGLKKTEFLEGLKLSQVFDVNKNPPIHRIMTASS